MQIKERPLKKSKYSMWNRRFRGYPAISINNGTYIRKFKTEALYNAAKEAISMSTFAHPLDFRQWLSKLITGFESDVTTVPMMDSITLPNNIFLPAPGEDFIDS